MPLESFASFAPIVSGPLIATPFFIFSKVLFVRNQRTENAARDQSELHVRTKKRTLALPRRELLSQQSRS